MLEKETTAVTTNHRSFYTDLTRAQREAAVYANDRMALPDAAARLSDKTCALDVVGMAGGGAGGARENRAKGVRTVKAQASAGGFKMGQSDCAY